MYAAVTNLVVCIAKRSGTVYRGIDAVPDIANYDQSTKIHWGGFSSTTVDPAVARRFSGAGIVFKLEVHNAKDIQPFSYYGNMEVRPSTCPHPS